MEYICHIPSPLGELTLRSNGAAIIALTPPIWRAHPPEAGKTADLPVFRQAAEWLEKYFTGIDPGPIPPIFPVGTLYHQRVWAALTRIPFGSSATYGDIARELNAAGHSPTSPRAVGSAVGRNPIAILIPCHRVLGTGSALTGYAWGLERKVRLLNHEGHHFQGGSL